MRPIWGPGPEPSLLQLYLTVARESYYYGQSTRQALPGYGSWYYVESTMNRILGESAPDWGRFSHPQISRGGGGPSAQTQTPPTSSKKRPQARARAQGGKSGAPARASQRGSRHGRKSCPKGHYWSYKEKKCLKSKFR